MTDTTPNARAKALLEGCAALTPGILQFEVATAQKRWAAAHHPLYQFVFQTLHKDIAIAQLPPAAASADASGSWAKARTAARRFGISDQ